MKRALLLALVTCLALQAADAPAVIVDLKKDPSLAVKAYLGLDQKGARLDAMSWETLRPYINWTRELSWGIVVVIEDYEVIDDIKAWDIVSLTDVWIPVRFKVLGTMDWDEAAFYPDAHVEDVRYHVTVVGDRWRIMEPILPPHVGQKRLVNHVREAMLQETDAAKLAVLTELRDSLRKAQAR